MSMNKTEIVRAYGREILDSRGNPTVCATVELSCGSIGTASVPSGASTGAYEAHERRDTHAQRYGGKGVEGAVRAIFDEISPAIAGKCAENQAELDRAMCELDGSENKSRIGANAILAVSLASARAAASPALTFSVRESFSATFN